jgi:hypothetical protein
MYRHKGGDTAKHQIGECVYTRHTGNHDIEVTVGRNRWKPFNPTRKGFVLDSRLLGRPEFMKFDDELSDEASKGTIIRLRSRKWVKDDFEQTEICRGAMDEKWEVGEAGRIDLPRNVWAGATEAQFDEVVLLMAIQLYRYALGWQGSNPPNVYGSSGGGSDSNASAVSAGTSAAVANF